MIILEIEEGGWGEQQGMEAFDILVAINGNPINNMLDVRNAVMGTGLKPGDTVDLLIIRDGHFRKIPYEITWIDFTNYLDFYDSSMDEKEMPRVPEPDKPEEPVEDEPSNGWLEFNGGQQDPLSISQLRVDAQVGDLYIFPYTMLHGVYPFNGTDEVRRTMSYNCNLYKPGQVQVDA